MQTNDEQTSPGPVEAIVMPPNWVTICNSLRDEPETWKATKYQLTHSSGVSFWVGNGWLFLDADASATDVHLSLLGKWKVWQAYRQWKRWQLPVFMMKKVKVSA